MMTGTATAALRMPHDDDDDDDDDDDACTSSNSGKHLARQTHAMNA